MRRLKILHHAQCFDGAASASLFGRFYRERIEARTEVLYQPKHHARGPVFEDQDFDADEHAVVDFRYSPDARLGWWFDHHASAFQPPSDGEHYAGRPRDRFFFDADARSCTKFLAESLARSYGWDWSRHAELVAWADRIDGAQFESAEQATQRSEPALRLSAFLEHNPDPRLEARVIDALTTTSLTTLADDRHVRAVVAPLAARDRRAEAIVRARIALEHGVALLDVLDEDPAEIGGYNKFLPYLVAPACRYAVAVGRGGARGNPVTKISVGINPWNPPSPLTHVATLCERYGGGGHAVVGGVTLPGGTAEAIADARRIAHELADALRRGPGARPDPK